MHKEYSHKNLTFFSMHDRKLCKITVLKNKGLVENNLCT